MPQSRRTVLAALALAALTGCVSHAQTEPNLMKSASGKYWIFVGTYTGPNSKGIHRMEMDVKTGAIEGLEQVAELANPTFLAVNPAQSALYAVSEIGNFDGKKAGGVAAFSIDRKSGKLTAMNTQPSGGTGPCHLIVDPGAKNVLVANYGGGSVAVLPLEKDGSLKVPSCTIQHTGKGPNPRRQEGPHAHGIFLDPSHQFALVPDLGLDKIMVYRFVATDGQLKLNTPPAANTALGAGPRHLAFHPTKNWIYAINEMASTVVAYSFDPASGTLTEIGGVSTLPEDFKPPSTTAEIAVHPNGKFLYGSNRGHDSIAVFSINPQSGALTPLARVSTGGKGPRHFALDPTGQWLLAANQSTNNILLFRVNAETGTLTPTPTTMTVSAPVCLVFVPKE